MNRPTATDGEIIPTPAEQPEAEAWLQLVARIGSDVGRMADGQDRRDRGRRTKVAGIKVPAVASGIVPASGTLTLDLGAPAAGRQWSVRRLLLVDATNPGGAITGGAPTAKTTAFAAGAAGVVGLPAGATMTGFDITTAPVAAAQSGTVTVNGLAAGTLSYVLAEQVSGGTALSVRFPTPLPAIDGSSFPQVSVPAIASGAAYSVTVYGTTATAGSTPGAGWWYVGVPAVYGPQTAAAIVPALPFTDDFGGEQITILPRDRLFAVVAGATPGRTLIARADLLDIEQGTATAVESI